MKQCIKCFQEYPDRDFTTKNKPHTECKKCIARERARKGMKKLRAKNQFVERLQMTQNRLTDRQATLATKTTQKSLQTAFLRAVAVTKQRIRVMEAIENPKSNTLRAIAVRKALLGRYTKAYEEQTRMLEAGIFTPNIHDMV